MIVPKLEVSTVSFRLSRLRSWHDQRLIYRYRNRDHDTVGMNMILLALCIVHNVLGITTLRAFECIYIDKSAKFIKIIQGNGTQK
jgi:hypothetical protein